jgi:hypothetical protein
MEVKMAVERESPYIWVTWLTKLMAGESQCKWASWFKAHNTYEKLPSDFDLAKWTAQHNDLLQNRRTELELQGFSVYVEDQNSFKIVGKDNIAVSGKADIVAIRESEAYVEDCKTGKQKHSDSLQVLTYMLVLPVATTHCKGLRLNGRVVYRNNVVEIPASKIGEDFGDRFRNIVHEVGGVGPLKKAPSWGECRWCDIPKAECPVRIDSRPTATPKDHDLF